MDRRKLKCGGKPRRKAFLGADAAITAAATLAAAGINAAATASAAKSQAKAVTESARTQADSIKAQTANNNNLQQQSINFTRQQNQENRQQQQDIQTTLQLLAGQQNMNDRMAANKIQVKMGGRPKKRSLKASSSSYRGVEDLFNVTDGGGVIPVSIDQNGYGIYELFGNDHDHYHNTSSGKRKTGVGIEFSDGSVVEGEGNQNTNRGELMYITPDDAMFISKHTIDGYNPRDAVMLGADPEEVFMTQELLKARKGLKDDGTKAKCGTRKSLRKTYGGLDVVMNNANLTQLPSNGTGNVAGGIIYALPNRQTTPPIAKYGNRISIKRPKAEAGIGYIFSNHPYYTDKFWKSYFYNNKHYGIGFKDYYDDYVKQELTINALPEFTFTAPANKTKANTSTTNNTQLNTIPTDTTKSNKPSFWDNYGGAVMNAAGNLLGAGITSWGNMYAGKTLGNAYSQAGGILADAYSQMKGIDMSEVSREDFAAPHSLAVIRSANTNINPQLERLRRNADSERRAINRGTISSAARQQRLAATNDRLSQRMSEQYAYKDNADEQIKQGNAKRITQTAAENADRDVLANKDYTTQRLSLLQYNNNIENARIAGMAQARADALTQAQTVNSQAFQNSMGAVSSALAASGQAFGTAFDTNRKLETEAAYSLLGMPDNQQAQYIISTGNEDAAQALFNKNLVDLTNPTLSPETRALIISDLTRLKTHFPKLNGNIPEK